MSRDTYPSLKLTAKDPENGRLEDDPFLGGPGNFFSGKLAVFFLSLPNEWEFSNQQFPISTL